MEFVDLFAFFLVFAKILMVAVGVCFLISGIDDLFVDMVFVLRAAYRALVVVPRHAPLCEQQLHDKPQQRLAVMIPAWDEAAVIGKMLANTLRTIDYRNYTIFVGTYRNDLATQREVEQVGSAQVVRIVTPHDGPTNKADCLNWIFDGIKRHEAHTGQRFEVFVMQDCEDVIHPLCYKLFNYLVPRIDMVQLPVESLETRWTQPTAGHYLDEFAQSHYKDMPVREALGANLPAAGVGAAFSRKAFDLVCARRANELFSVDSLTEDYEFGVRLGELGLRQAFVRFAVMRSATRISRWSGKPVQVRKPDVVCVREYFPAKFSLSVRQKSRWVVGITLQGWKNLGWSGGLATRYMLVRDRKAIVTNLANLMGYLLVLLVLGMRGIDAVAPDAYRFPPLLEKDSLLWSILYVNAALFALRVFMRGYCVYRRYDLAQALLSFPRMIWGNLINFMATARAIRQYLQFLKTGKFIKWDKTAHHYPGAEQLASLRRKLGDVLIDANAITIAQLSEALSLQQKSPKKLGELLQELGWIQPDTLKQALQKQ